MKDTNSIDQERQRRGEALATEMREALEPRTAFETAAAFVYGMADQMSFPPLPPSPAEVGDLILQTREHVQMLGWGNRERLYTESQVRAIMSECAVMAAMREQAAERKRIERDVAGLHMAQSVNNQNHPSAWHDGIDAALDVIRGA